MKLLADAHAIVWLAADDPRLGIAARDAMLAEGNDVFVSIATVWELSIKQSLAKGEFEMTVADMLRLGHESARINFLSVDVDDALASGGLPYHHRDPFDRMIIAQALRRDWAVVTVDRQFSAYGVKTVW